MIMTRWLAARKSTLMFLSSWLGCVCLMAIPCLGQEGSDAAGGKSVGTDGGRTIVIETHEPAPPTPLIFTSSARSNVNVGSQRIEQVVELKIKVVQGEAKKISLGVHGDGQITDVQGEQLQSWSLRKEGAERFLDLHAKDDVTELDAVVNIRSADFELPATVDLTHLTPGESIGFDSSVDLVFSTSVDAVVTEATGFAPVEAGEDARRFQSATGGNIKLSLQRDGASPDPIELSGTTLSGRLHPNGRSIAFQFQSTVSVTEANAEITVLSGNAAFSDVPNDAGYRLRLSTEGERPAYKLSFSKEGTYPVKLDFVASVSDLKASWKGIDFTIAASAVVPLTLDGLEGDLEFLREQHSVVPLWEDGDWSGFLPATGQAKLQWKTARESVEGTLFFSTTGRIEARVGAGLLRQDHQIDYQVLQGELTSITMLLRGPGEILDVKGPNIIAWKVSDKGEDRLLEATLSQPVTGASQVMVRSQTPLGAFPVRVEGLRLNPVGAIRHSGFLRLSNLGSVRLTPTDLSGLTQLAPEQFPGDAVEARQTFVYRFPAAEHAFTVAADRIQPEVNVSELVLYQLAEADRVIHADVELDIREAPIREWDFGIPADYSVVSVIGASVADYVVGTQVDAGRRNLKVIFAQDVSGRQLVTLDLEKSEVAAAGDWVLPRIEYAEAKTLRGDIGIMGAPGFRIAVGETDLLVEKPLSYFPKPTPNLQQAFRIREPGWSATMQIDLLERSVQADVFHLYSLSQQTVFGSALLNYYVTGSPVSEWRITAPAELGNVMIDGQDIRTWRREGETLIVSLHQPVMGAYTLLVTFEEKPDENDGEFQAGQVTPVGVQGERGYVQVVSPVQVDLEVASISDDMLKLDPLELPAEFRLLSTAPPLGTWQYTERPFTLNLDVSWYQPGTTATQVVEFSEANSRVSQDGELVTDILYYVKSRGRRTLRIKMPPEPVRLWEVTVDGQPVTARQTDDATLIPLPGGTDPNIPVQVSLRLGKPTVDESNPELMLPVVSAPVLKTQWRIAGDEKHLLVPSGGSVNPPESVLRPSGFEWVAKRGMFPLLLIGLLSCFGVWACRGRAGLRALGLLSLVLAMIGSAATVSNAMTEIGKPSPLRLSLPILSAGETVDLEVKNVPLWRVDLSWIGLTSIVLGIGAVVWPASRLTPRFRLLFRGGGVFLIALGVLSQGAGAPWFFGLLGIAIFIVLFIQPAWAFLGDVRVWAKRVREQRRSKKETRSTSPGSDSGAVTATIALLALTLMSAGSCWANGADAYQFADSVDQDWTITHRTSRLSVSATTKLTGKPGDQFLMLKAPAVLTRFSGDGLRLTKRDVPGEGLTYVLSVPVTDDDNAPEADRESREFEASFEYQLEAIKPSEGVPVLTGNAAVDEIDLRYDEAGWEIACPSAVRIETLKAELGTTHAKVLLGPGKSVLSLKPKARDVTTEQTQFFVEASNVYLPGPGVVDGRHRLRIRVSQGQVGELNVQVPSGLTVSAVSGPVGSWQFDADRGGLRLDVEPAQSQGFDVTIDTQRSLDPLPADVNLAPLRVSGADGEVGLVAIAFGADAQPESIETDGLSAVNLGDFDASLIPQKQAVLHRVYRYGVDGGTLSLRVTPVDSEVRVFSKQVLSLGDERVVLGVNFATEISRAGLFQLSFSLPDGLEVDSLTGDALHHWAELRDGDQRQIVLHLNGKTIGSQTFSLALSGTPPTDGGDWTIPRFELNEATRQTGELVVRPTTGIRLRTVSRQNVSETDPRSMGGRAQGALAFRLLQRDWNLVLGIEKLAPWVTGQVLHEVTMREGQTRSMLAANFNVQNASIRTLRVILPITNEDEIKTLRASGDTVSDFVRTAPDSDIWEIQFKRRVVGRVRFRIEYERRGNRDNDQEAISPIGFPQARQLAYFFGVRAGGRLELSHDTLTQGWQRSDWQTVPQVLREMGNRNAPALVLRAVAPANTLTILAKRHSLADALKLRVASGSLTTVLSTTGGQLTAVDLTMEVIQRSPLRVELPEGCELFSVFVNGESVNSIRQGGGVNAWQFNILPGIDDRTAAVRFVYSYAGEPGAALQLSSPQLNVPLENVEWNVVAPKGFELTDDDGNLELVRQTYQKEYDRDSYLSKVGGKRQIQAQNAAKLLEQANELLQAGEQAKARWALNSVANQYALDAASNEDARVQLENLQTQQAIVGLNTRRQRLYLDNRQDETALPENEQLRQAAADNPILQQDRLNFRPQQLSQLLRGNTTEDNAVLQQIAGRLVQHQRTTEPAPQAIIISLPEEGTVYTFSRSVQVAENSPLELELDFDLQSRVRSWQFLSLLALLLAFSLALALATVRKDAGGAAKAPEQEATAAS